MFPEFLTSITATTATTATTNTSPYVGASLIVYFKLQQQHQQKQIKANHIAVF